MLGLASQRRVGALPPERHVEAAGWTAYVEHATRNRTVLARSLLRVRVRLRLRVSATVRARA